MNLNRICIFLEDRGRSFNLHQCTSIAHYFNPCYWIETFSYKFIYLYLYILLDEVGGNKKHNKDIKECNKDRSETTEQS